MENDNNILNWAIIGCGDVAERKGGPPLYKTPGSALRAVMSRDLTKAEDFARRHQAEAAYNALDELLKDDLINAVYIATPVFLHYEQVLQAAEAGKHVLCEKPMAMDVQQCQKMIAACRRHDVALMIAYYRRMFPVILKLKSLIDSGAIGKAVFTRIEKHSVLNFTEEWAADWKFNPQMSGGGVLMDIGSHRLDLLLYLFGDVADINGHAETASLPMSVDDSITFELKFMSGVRAIGSICWNLHQSSDLIEVFGTDGKISIPEINDGRIIVETGQDREILQLPVLSYTHSGLIENFRDHLASGKPNCSAGESALKVNAMMGDIYRSSGTFDQENA